MEKRNVNKNSVAALLVVIAVLGYGLIGKAGNLEPSAAPAPTMKTLDEVEPRISISQADIPLTISTRGSYYLTEEVTAAGTAIAVDANNVTIDLMGYNLIGPGSGTNYGIYMNGRSNVEIRNGTIRGFEYGIYEKDEYLGKDHRLIDVRSVSNVQGGIYLFGSGHLVKDCTASYNGNSAAGNVFGIYAGYASMVTGNTTHRNGISATGSTVYGIYAASGSTVTGNTAHYNGYLSVSTTVYGIYAEGGCTVIFGYQQHDLRYLCRLRQYGDRQHSQ
jgi:hypothetical protein